MIVKGVDVRDAKCHDRPCYCGGFDKGSFVPGRGYTYYRDRKERRVCMTRHVQGCPTGSMCPTCKTLEVDGPGTECAWCRLHSVRTQTVAVKGGA